MRLTWGAEAVIAINMPQVGQDIPSARIVEWRKAENDPVEKGEVVLLVESDKATFEVEAEEGGILLKILHEQDEEVEIFQPLGYIGQPGEGLDESALEPLEDAAAASVQPLVETSAAATARVPDGGVVASPSARRVARERGLNLATFSGTGPGGRIVKRDVVAADAGVSPQLSPGDTVVPFGKMRRRIAERLTMSQQTVPTFTLYTDVDMTETAHWRRRLNERPGTHVTVTDLIIKASADALRAFERMNAHVYADRMVVRGRVNVGVAVAVADGLLVPVIPDADAVSLQETSELSRKVGEAAARGVIVTDAVGTFTVSSLGMHGVSRFEPIINPPECAILGVGSIEQRVVAADGAIRLRDMMAVTLTCDHRAVDGAYAAAFLKQIRTNLESFPSDPETGR